MDRRRAACSSARSRRSSWTNSDGGTIEGVLTRPVGYTAGTRYPLVVNPHGGPSGANTEGFSALNQVLAANGFLVLQINFRGSTNYGQKHLNANRNTWGVTDYDDIMKGVDYVIAQGWADPNRMVAYGWSYGGYMTFWMSTQTDRFKLISPGAGLTNLYSMYSTTDIPAYLGWFFGTPWENEAIYQKLSPIRFAKNVKSKILIMHGANDARVPPTQADEFYKALKDLGKDVTYVRYPRQGHGITETRLAMDRDRRYVCAFTHAVGLTSTTESCKDGVPAPSPDNSSSGGSGRDLPLDVDLPFSGLANDVDGTLIERGTFQSGASAQATAAINEELWEAARAGDAARVTRALEKGADVNAKARYGATALTFAADRGHIEIVKLLLDRGADINAQDTFYQMRAARHGGDEQPCAGCDAAAGARIERCTGRADDGDPAGECRAGEGGARLVRGDAGEHQLGARRGEEGKPRRDRRAPDRQGGRDAGNGHAPGRDRGSRRPPDLRRLLSKRCDRHDDRCRAERRSAHRDGAGPAIVDPGGDFDDDVSPGRVRGDLVSFTGRGGIVEQMQLTQGSVTQNFARVAAGGAGATATPPPSSGAATPSPAAPDAAALKPAPRGRHGRGPVSAARTPRAMATARAR